jgi:hypothetical protein
MSSRRQGEVMQLSALEKAAAMLRRTLVDYVVEVSAENDARTTRVDVWEPRGRKPIYSWSGPSPRSDSEIMLFVSKVIADVKAIN